jgi:hypothetical protein
MRTSGSTGERSEPERRPPGGGPQGERAARVILVRQPIMKPAYGGFSWRTGMRTSGSTGERSEPERRPPGGGPQGERAARVILVRQPIMEPAARRVFMADRDENLGFDRRA